MAIPESLHTTFGALGVAATGTRVHALGGDAARSGAFAMVTDTHANPEEPDRTAALERIFTHIEERDPAFVLNCGDITDLGAADEFELYSSTIPPALRDKVRSVPGNHENQYLVDALEAFDAHIDEIGRAHV